jgi:hypothetical protein
MKIGHGSNSGIQEFRDLGIEGILSFSILSSTFGGPLSQYSSIPKPIIPIFHHSNVPIA